MIDQLLNEINNYFIRSVEYMPFIFLNSTITGFGETYLAGQYINIDGSYLNDGTYKIVSNINGVITVDATLQAETNWCYMFGLGIPKSVIDLASKLTTYTSNLKQGIVSESQGQRSVTYKDSSNWQVVYKNELNSYRMAISDKARWKSCGKQTL